MSKLTHLLINEAIYHEFDTPLGFLKEIKDSQHRDLSFIGALSALSVLPNYLFNYQGRTHSPNLFLAICGESGADKSKALIASSLLEDIVDRLRERRVNDKKRYLDELAICKNERERSEVPPPFKGRITVAPNITDARFVNELERNPLGLLMIAPEADSLIASMKSQYGAKLSADFRAIFDNQPVEKLIVQDDIDIYIKHPRMSFLLTGTPGQFKHFSKGENAENGLFARLLFYRCFQNFKGAKINAEQEIDLSQIKQAINKMYQDLSIRRDPLFFNAKKEHKAFLESEFDSIYALISKRSQKYHTLLMRLLFSTYRIFSLLSLVRHRDKIMEADSITSSDADLEVVISLFKTFVRHITYLTDEFGIADSKKKLGAIDVLGELPNVFPFSLFCQKAMNICGVSSRTAERWLSEKLVENRWVERAEDGTYVKIEKV